MPFVDRLKQAILDRITNDTTGDGFPAQLWLGLGTNAGGPSEDDDTSGDYANEVSTSGTAYARIRILASEWDAASTTAGVSTIDTNVDVTFAEATGSGFGTVAHAILYDASTGGNIVSYGTITNVLISAGDQLRFQSGNITLQLD